LSKKFQFHLRLQFMNFNCSYRNIADYRQTKQFWAWWQRIFWYLTSPLLFRSTR